MTDKRPDPKPRKHAQLWQSYLLYDEFVEWRKKHALRISSITKGKSNMDLQIEKDAIKEFGLSRMRRYAEKLMISHGSDVGPIWDWLRGIRGFKTGGITAQLLAYIDDIGKFDTISKLWRFAGLAVIDGKAEPKDSPHYSRRFKSICWQIGELFVKMQTSLYADLYYEFYEDDRRKHPNTLCRDCGIIIPKTTGGKWKCPENQEHKIIYNPAHIMLRSQRRAVKIFLQHLWLKWRQFEGLPVSEPYVQAIMGHTNIVPPPE